MILVDCVTATAAPSQSADEILTSLLRNPTLISASDRLKSTPERKVTGSEPINLVYVFQREYATVDPNLVKFVGTDEATTCVGLVIRNRETGMTSVSHMDFEGIVDAGLSQMLSLLANHQVETTLDVHLIGGFDDVKDVKGTNGYAHKKPNGYSLPLCSKIIESLQNRKEKFHLQTLCVLGHNTKINLQGIPLPIITGFLVETSSGMVVPASFDNTSRGPDELVRRVRISVSFEDPNLEGKLLDTYDTHFDKFCIAPCSWVSDWRPYAFYMLQLPNSDFLWQGSTSPYAESPDFVENEKRKWKYLFEHPDWRLTFEDEKPRIFVRAPDGQWKRSTANSSFD